MKSSATTAKPRQGDSLASVAGPLETISCPACCSGLNTLLSDELSNAAA